jgi:hypothetical protein
MHFKKTVPDIVFHWQTANILVEALVMDLVQTAIHICYYKTFIEKTLCVLLSQPHLRLLYQWRTGKCVASDGL